MGEVEEEEGVGFRGAAQTPQPLEQKDLCMRGTLLYVLSYAAPDPNRGCSNHTI